MLGGLDISVSGMVAQRTRMDTIAANLANRDLLYLGVSGDGVEQNDLIAFDGGRGFEPPPELRIDNFTFAGVRLPYLKFPQTPR